MSTSSTRSSKSLGSSFAYDDELPFWIDGPDLPRFYETVDWSDIDFISHNAKFDALILAFIYKKFPKRYGCTLSMMQNWLVHQTGSVSLDALGKRYGLQKGYLPTKGVNFLALTRDAQMYQATRTYAIQDLNICRYGYRQMMADGFPPSELEVVDWVIRMAAIPQLEVDRELIAQHLGEVLAAKQKLLDDAALETRDPVMRDESLAAALMFFGVNPVPRKISKGTGKEQWAFAKTDREFTDLLEHRQPCGAGDRGSQARA